MASCVICKMVDLIVGMHVMMLPMIMAGMAKSSSGVIRDSSTSTVELATVVALSKVILVW